MDAKKERKPWFFCFLFLPLVGHKCKVRPDGCARQKVHIVTIISEVFVLWRVVKIILSTSTWPWGFGDANFILPSAPCWHNVIQFLVNISFVCLFPCHFRSCHSQLPSSNLCIPTIPHHLTFPPHLHTCSHFPTSLVAYIYQAHSRSLLSYFSNSFVEIFFCLPKPCLLWPPVCLLDSRSSAQAPFG